MPKATLDDKFAKRVERPEKGFVEFSDDRVGGFEVRVYADRIVGTYRYRPLGSKTKKRHPLGEHPNITMAAMRNAAEAARGAVKAGHDPAAEREAVKAERQRRDTALDFNGLVEVYLPELAKQKKTWEQDKGYLERDAQPYWGDKRIEEISKADCAARLLTVAKRAPVSANRLRSALMRFFDWCVAQGLLLASPMVGIPKPTKEKKGEIGRVMNDAELVVIWRAIEATKRLSPGVRATLKVLALTGQRPNEIAGLALSELHYVYASANFDPYANIPASRMKGGRAHVWPISQPVADIIKAEIARQQKDANEEDRPVSDFVFASRFQDKVRIARHSLSQAMRRIIDGLPSDGEDAEIVKTLKADRPTPHSFRRTVISGMGRLGIPREDRKAVVAHAEDDVLAGHYDAYDRFAEKKMALDRWAAHVTALLSGQKETGVVIPMRAR